MSVQSRYTATEKISSNRPESRVKRAGFIRATLLPVGASLLLLYTACSFSSDNEALPARAERVEPNDQFFQSGSQWNLEVIRMPEAWWLLQHPDVRPHLRQVTVAVVDSGIPSGHPDFGPFVPGWDFSSDVQGDWLDSEIPEEGMDPATPGLNHGTHVAGIIGALTNNSGQGIAGAGWSGTGQTALVRIMPVRALEGTDGNVEGLRCGVAFAAGLECGGVPGSPTPVQVMNLSLGAAGDIGLGEFFSEISSGGITIVAAAGNDSAEGLIWPARYALNGSVIAAGSIDQTGTGSASLPATVQRSAFSNYGEGLDLVAPGGSSPNSGGVWSTVANDGYAVMAGTSMATPHVSAVAALLYAVSPDMDQERVRRILRETARSVGPELEYGAGVLDAYEAVRAALTTAYGGPLLAQDIPSLPASTAFYPSLAPVETQSLSADKTRNYDNLVPLPSISP